MDSSSMNPYEKQLYSVFKTFDVDNEEALDKSAVVDLCDALQLEDRGTALTDCLFEGRADRVTFEQFRNGLLSVLSGGESPAPEPEPAPKDVARGPLVGHSDEESGTEVAPKFVFGSKKYGRRSRPHRSSGDEGSPRAASVSRLDAEDKRNRSLQRMRCRRSASAMESRDLSVNSDDEADDAAPPEADHERRVDCVRALALCRDLRMEGIDRSLVERVFRDSGANETTVGEFFDRLNASLTSSIEESRTGAPIADRTSEDDDEDHDDANVASEAIVEAWERAGVSRPRRLLLELGFGAAVVRPPDLERALDEEAAVVGGRAGATRLHAAGAALARLRLARARGRAERVAAERDRLRAAVAEADRRAALLAQDVDEAHARMQVELAATARRADARLQEAARRAAADAVAAAERDAARVSRFEAEAARHVEAENRLREELTAERKRAERLEECVGAAEARAATAERETSRLAEEARQATAAAAIARAAAAGPAEADAARLERLRRELQELRDRNDELCVLLEARSPPPRRPVEAGGALAAELSALIAPDAIEECDSSPISSDHRPESTHRGVIIQIRSILETVQDIPLNNKEMCKSCSLLENVVTDLKNCVLNLSEAAMESSPLVNTSEKTETKPTDAYVQTEPIDLNSSSVEATVAEDEKQKYLEVIKDLEVSLEQMREEYERCEEYWSQKLSAEREEFETERRCGDERLAELAARVQDYERAYLDAQPMASTPLPGGRLPPIEERAALEAQVNDLEEECRHHQEQAERLIKAKDEELSRLRTRLEAVETKLRRSSSRGGSGCAGKEGAGREGETEGCACSVLAERCGRLDACLWAARGAGVREAAALRARAARAEAAVRRLAGRLRAADLLVKDLYIENCHLAHLRP